MVSESDFEFYAADDDDDRGSRYVNFTLNSDRSLEIDVTDGMREGRYGDAIANYTNLRFDPEQTVELLALIQAWIEQL